MDFYVETQSELLAALKKARPADVIFLSEGDYGKLQLRNYTFKRPVVIRSKSSAKPAVIKGFSIKGSSGIRFQSLILDYEFKTGEPDHVRPFAITNSKNITIENSELDGAIDPGTQAGNGYGLFVTDSESINISNNKIFDFGRGAVFTDVDKVTVVGNEVFGIRTDGMDFVEASNIRIEKNYFHDFLAPKVTNDHRDMVQFWTTNAKRPNVSITIKDNRFDIGNGSWTQSIFMRNELVDTGKAGKEMFYRDVTITGNTIYNYHLHGITVGETEGLKIENNKVLQAVGKLSAPGNKDLKGTVSAPLILVAEKSQMVSIRNNVTRKISGYTNQKDWKLSGNVIVQPEQYKSIFKAPSLSKGAPHDFKWK